jgi:hypothetical protein
MKLRVFPIYKTTVAIVGGAAEVDGLILVLEEADVAAKEEVLAFGAEAHLVKGPPLLERVVGLEEFEFAAKGGDEGMQEGVGVLALFGHGKINHCRCVGSNGFRGGRVEHPHFCG